MAVSRASPETTYQGASTMSDVVPMTLFDLDASGLDPTQPAPPEFIQFLYDNSRSGYLTLWSHLLAEPDGTTAIQRWLNDALEVYHARSLQTQMAPPGDKPAGESVTEITYTTGATADASSTKADTRAANVGSGDDTTVSSTAQAQRTTRRGA